MSAKNSKKQRKERVAFTLKKDVLLLRAALTHNPFQLGEDLWKDVANEMTHEFKDKFTARAVKKRVELLIDKFNKKQLKYSSGTEEETTERGFLLETIIAIKEEENVAINTEITADDDDDVEDNEEQDVSDRPAPVNISAKQRRLERIEADRERTSYIDEAPGPSGSRDKRQRLSVEEEVMMQKHKHDMEVEKEKIEIEKLRVKSEQNREDQRLNLEQQREDRLKEESKRRDEIAKSQVDLQTKMIEVMQKFMEK